MAQPTDVALGHIEEILATYGDLQAQFDRVRDRLRRADEQKHTVARRIYDRVRSEYDRELDTIRARMSPLREELDRVRAGIEADLSETAAALERAREEQQEAEFRHRIGEFGDGGFESALQPLELRAAGLQARFDELARLLAVLEAAKAPAPVAGPAAATGAPAAPATAPAMEPETVSIAVEPEMEAILAGPEVPATLPASPMVRPARSSAGSVDGFENPQSWLDELGRDLHRRDRPAPATAAVARPASPAATATAPRTGTPSLVFVNGAHAGQAMALLQTTLTIGREHDNNIEIKDAEVARYHARVMHDRGDWVVEDLDTPTGTWVNGQRTKRAPLHHGDVIRVGSTELALDFDWTAGTKTN